MRRRNRTRALQEAKSEAERQRVFVKSDVGPEQYSRLFQMLARLYPKDQAMRLSDFRGRGRRELLGDVVRPVLRRSRTSENW